MAGLPGVRGVTVDLERDLFTVSAGPGGPDDATLLRTVRELGYQPSITAAPGPAATPAEKASNRSLPEPILSALARARREEKLLLVEFHAPWCPACRRLREETLSDDRVRRALDRFVVVEVDTDALPDVARRFSVISIPEVRILEADGKEAARIQGFRPADEFLAVLARSAPRRREVESQGSER